MDTLMQSTAAVAASPVVELRHYTLHPGKGPVLAALFGEHFITGQEALGMRLHGEFSLEGHPDEFVWLRGFPSLEERPGQLAAFYGGPDWKAHREVANATMLDSDNVLLLQPVESRGFTLARRMAATMTATVYLLQTPVDAAFEKFFRDRVTPLMAQAGAPPVAELKTLEVANNFPKLPVRQGEHAFVWFAAFPNDEALRRHDEALAASPAWRDASQALEPRLAKPVERLVLHPSPRTLDRFREPYRYTLDVAGGPHDFDFLEGAWTVASHRLRERGAHSGAWEDFAGTSRDWSLLGGMASVDQIEFPSKGWAGMTVRHYERERRQWSLHWIDSRDGRLQPAVQGGFDGDTGLFFGEDVDAGRPVKAVYRWTRQGATKARWEQAFSYDGGATWETNWVMDFTRSAAAAK